MRTKAEKTSTATRPLLSRERGEQPPFFQGRRPGELSPSAESSFFPPVQPRLEISRPEDPLEKEAELMADKVMQPIETPVLSSAEEEGEGKAASPPGSGLLSPCCTEAGKMQRMAAPGFFPDSGTGGEYVDMVEEEAPPLTVVQPRRDGTESGLPEGRAPPGRAPPLEDRLYASKGGGAPLPSDTRDFMESRFGADFSSVRVHTDAGAQHMAAEIHAQAFTHGRDIYFNVGRFAPGTEAGQRLLAHELTHTLQQGGASYARPARMQPAASEAEASVQRTAQTGPKERAGQGLTADLETLPENEKEEVVSLSRYADGDSVVGLQEKGGGPELLERPAVKAGMADHPPFAFRYGSEQPDSREKPGDFLPSRVQRFREPALGGEDILSPIRPGGSGHGHGVGRAAEASHRAASPYDIGERESLLLSPGDRGDLLIPRALGNGHEDFSGIPENGPQTKGEAFGAMAGGERVARSPTPEPFKEGPGDPEMEKEEAMEVPSPISRISRQGTEGGDSQEALQVRTEQAPPSRVDREAEGVGIGWDAHSAAPSMVEEEPEREAKVHGPAPRGPPILQRMASSRLQCGWFSDAMAWVDSALDYAAEGLDRGKALLLAEARDFALAIPGYRALRVVLGEDPVTGEFIQRNGDRFLEAALDIIPGGRLLQEKLREMGILSQATAWIDARIRTWQTGVNSVIAAIQRFWDQLSLRDLARPFQVFERAGQLLYSSIRWLVDQTLEAGRALLEMIKEVLIDQVLGFMEEHTPAYPLLTVILGQDPIQGRAVPRNGNTILEAMMDLGGEEGREQRRQMLETGTWGRATAWIDEGIGVFQGSYDQIRQAFHLVWDQITVASLTQPLITFHRVLALFVPPVNRVLGFMGRTVSTILGFIKEALMQRLSVWARGTRGYTLLTVIIGQDPFSGQQVARDADGLVHGFLSLMEGGEEQYQQLRASGAIERASQRVLAAVQALNMTPTYLHSLFLHTWNQFGFADLAEPLAAFARILRCFSDPIRRLVRFVVTMVRLLLEVLLGLMQFPVGLLSRILNQVMESFSLISQDPVGFLKNLVSAIKQGFVQFFRNIGRHLVQGLLGWLMGELREAGMPVLQDFSLGGVIRWVLEVLGITVERIWQKLAEHPQIGPERVARIRTMIDRVEGIWSFLRDVQERGIAAIWEWIQERLFQLWDTVMNAVKEWVMERIITQMVTRLLSLLDPTGIMAVVNSAIALFRAVQSFVRYLREMLEVIGAFVEGVLEIAQGNLQTAATALENSLARSVPIVIGFLANQLGLSGIGRRIGEIIGRVRGIVDQALSWLVNKAVRIALPALRRLVDIGRDLGERVLGWLGIRRQVTMLNGESHTLYFDDSGEEPVLMMASRPRKYIDFVQSFQAPSPELQRHKEAALSIARDIDRLIRTRRRGEDGQRDPTHNGTRIAALIDQLVVHTRHFQVTGGEQPPSVVRYGPVNEHGGGSFAHAEILSRTNIQGGSPSGKPLIMQRAERRRPAASFIQGHLLNDNLGGKGNSYNLTPITGVMARVDGSCANTRHLNLVERQVKQLVLDEGKVVDYRVEARYGGHTRQRTFHQQLREKQREGRATAAEIRKLEIMDYEQRFLCTELVNTWCLREKDPGSGEWVRKEETCQRVVIPNDLPDGDFEAAPS